MRSRSSCRWRSAAGRVTARPSSLCWCRTSTRRRGRQRRRHLAPELDDGTLLLVSTDLTHYGAAFGFAPFAGDIAAEVERLDAGALLRVLAGDGPGLLGYGRQTGITMCGLEAAALALACGLPPGFESALLGYARSGDRDGDYSRSVSYAAALIADGGTAAGVGEP
ncbi:MAG: AmmeMemoRadiSam system protein B [bacterium]|nr:AmmeMemoRadiSam system protein B [bacterium]